MNDLNPGVERAIAAGGAEATIAEWLRILLADDEGRPAMLVAGLGLSSAAMLLQLEAARSQTLAQETLLRAAREHSIRLRADPTFTTDFLLIAALHHDPLLAEALGIRLDRIDELTRSPLVEGPTAMMDAPSATFNVPDVTDRHDAARIVDANLNRARESLRILDDYARFTRNDAVLTEMVKALRHRVAELEGGLPLASLLAARDTPRDVGTGVSAAGEYDRASPAHVARVNCKRLQEALRSLEEYGKLLSPHLAREAEAIRYEAYTLDRALHGGGNLRERLNDAKLYLLASGAGCVASLEWTIQEAIAGGVRIVQLREKTLNDRDLLRRATQVRDWTRKAHALFIVNDRPDIARLCGADGVHLGQDDMSVSDGRRILGADALVGVSTHGVEQVRAAVRDGADYLGVGPVFASTTKSFEGLAGPEFVRAAGELTSLPSFALGGINLKTIAAAGAKRVAVSAAICGADEPRMAATQLLAALDE